MIPSENIKKSIRGLEGFRPVAYRDGKGYSIGFGNSFYADGSPVKPGDTITRTEAERLFTTILNQFARSVSMLVTARINQNQFDGLLSLAYNIGTEAFRSSTLLKKVNAAPGDASIRQEFYKWVYSEGTMLSALVKRRKIEADWYFGLSGAWKKNSILASLMLAPVLLFLRIKAA